MVDPLALSNIAPAAFEKPSATKLQLLQLGRRPRVLLHYGSLRVRSYSRFLTLEAARLLEAFEADTRIFDPSGLPLPDDAPEDHSKVQSRNCAGSPPGRRRRFGVRRSGTAR